MRVCEREEKKVSDEESGGLVDRVGFWGVGKGLVGSGPRGGDHLFCQDFSQDKHYGSIELPSNYSSITSRRYIERGLKFIF